MHTTAVQRLRRNRYFWAREQRLRLFYSVDQIASGVRDDLRSPLWKLGYESAV